MYVYINRKSDIYIEYINRKAIIYSTRPYLEFYLIYILASLIPLFYPAPYHYSTSSCNNTAPFTPRTITCLSPHKLPYFYE